MAPAPTHLSHRGFEAWVVCDAQRLPVYSVEIHGEKVTCWIASEAGKNFSVHFKQTDKTIRHHIAGRVFVDGAFINGRVFGTVPPYAKAEEVIADMASGPTTVQKMFFSTMSTSDDDSAVKDNGILSQLGTISVQLQRSTILQRVDMPNFANDTPAHLQDGITVHEKAKKLGGHHTTLGEPQKVPAMRTVKTRSIEQPNTNYVEFEFKYRPKHVLQAQDVIPAERPAELVRQAPKRSHTSTLEDATNTSRPKKKIKSDPDSDDPEILRARIRELEAKLQERIEIDSDDSPIIKAEPVHAGRFFTKGQVIDLTDD